MTTTIRKIQNASEGYGDRSAKVRTSAVYGVFDGDQQVGEIAREGDLSYMHAPHWRVEVHGFCCYKRLLADAKDKAKQMVERYHRGDLVDVFEQRRAARRAEGNN